MLELNKSELKANEHTFQNAKYAKTSLQEEQHKTSLEDFERLFLTPIHLGGSHSLGLLFSRALGELFKNELRGRRVLDYCCGRGDLAVYLAKKGATVYGFDFSEKAIQIARLKARVNNVPVTFEVMDAEHLLYPDEYFDFAIGFEALHHVALHPQVPSELARVLRPGGEGIFAENWGGNNLLFQLWRNSTTLHRNQSASRGEVILHNAMLERFRGEFSGVAVEPLSLFYMSKKYLKNQSLLKALLKLDEASIRMMPFLKNYCGEAIIRFSR
jgi:ubiquinone/menaquinone biosynthesis C-methylase UbiE